MQHVVSVWFQQQQIMLKIMELTGKQKESSPEPNLSANVATTNLSEEKLDNIAASNLDPPQSSNINLLPDVSPIVFPQNVDSLPSPNVSAEHCSNLPSPQHFDSLPSPNVSPNNSPVNVPDLQSPNVSPKNLTTNITESKNNNSPKEDSDDDKDSEYDCSEDELFENFAEELLQQQQTEPNTIVSEKVSFFFTTLFEFS